MLISQSCFNYDECISLHQSLPPKLILRLIWEIFKTPTNPVSLVFIPSASYMFQTTNPNTQDGICDVNDEAEQCQEGRKGSQGNP